MVDKDKDKEESVEVLKQNVLLIASRVDELTGKVNEIVAILKDNNLTRKLEVDFIREEGEEEEEEGEEEEEEGEEEEVLEDAKN